MTTKAERRAKKRESRYWREVRLETKRTPRHVRELRELVASLWAAHAEWYYFHNHSSGRSFCYTPEEGDR